MPVQFAIKQVALRSYERTEILEDGLTREEALAALEEYRAKRQKGEAVQGIIRRIK